MARNKRAGLPVFIRSLVPMLRVPPVRVSA
jgi:hypothetical protein